MRSAARRGEVFMLLNVAILDDMPDEVEELEDCLDRYCRDRGGSCTIDTFRDPLKFLALYEPVYDIVFLDIDMPDMNGMDVARNLRKIDPDVALVFVTNMAQFAIRGYEVDADDFIVKPVRLGNLKTKLDRIMRKATIKEKPYVGVYDDGMVRYIPLAEIRYVEVIKHSIIYHTTTGQYEKRGALKDEAALFTANGFAQCNKSCIVNLRFVLGVDGYFCHVAKDKGSLEYEELTIGHPRKREFVHNLNRWLEKHL